METKTQTPEELLQMAIDFDVTTYETSQKLSAFLHSHTKWYWCKNAHGLFIKSLSEATELNNRYGDDYILIVCEAYRMQDISKKLPCGIRRKVSEEYIWDKKTQQAKTIDIMESYYLTIHFLGDKGDAQVIYENPRGTWRDYEEQAHIFKHNFAEGYGKLFLILQEKGLLNLKPKNL